MILIILRAVGFRVLTGEWEKRVFDKGTFSVRLPSTSDSEAWSEGIATRFCAGVYITSDMGMVFYS